MKTIMENIRLFKTLNRTVPRPVVPVPVKVCQDVTLADKFELFDSRGEPTLIEIKKLTGKELRSLVTYLEGYIEDYRSGKYMFRGRGHYPRAAFDEAGIVSKMIPMLDTFKKELARKL